MALATDALVHHAADILRRGGLVAFPTETVYGLGADALSEQACARIFAVKQRPRFDPLIVHVSDMGEIEPLCLGIDDRVRRLAEAFWPGPLTIVLPKRALVPDIVTAGEPTVALRVPSHPLARALLAATGRPIAAPSANPFGYISPTTAAHVLAQLGSEVDVILDGGACEIGIESTIVDLCNERPALLRPGGVEIERIEAIVGPLRRPAPGETLRAPGQLASHYAPRIPLTVLLGRAGHAGTNERLGLLAFGTPEPAVAATYAAVEILSPTESVREAATNLFACLRRLDRASVDAIVAERVPLGGLGVAIHDRLTRAAAGR